MINEKREQSMLFKYESSCNKTIDELYNSKLNCENINDDNDIKKKNDENTNKIRKQISDNIIENKNYTKQSINTLIDRYLKTY